MALLTPFDTRAKRRRTASKRTVFKFRVTYEIVDSIAVIAMDDGKVNALNFEMLADLQELLDRAEAEKVGVVLTGRPGVFSAGFDLDVIAAGGPDTARLLKRGFELSHRLLSFPRPVVIACSGHTLAMGVFILLSGDYRLGVANADHRIAANEVAIGMTMPRSAIEVARKRLSQEHIDRVVILSERFNPDSAMRVGLLDEVVPDMDLLSAAFAKAGELRALNRTAFAATKLRIRAGVLSAVLSAIEADYEELISAH